MNIMKERTKSSPRHLSLNLRKKKMGKSVSLAAKHNLERNSGWKILTLK